MKRKLTLCFLIFSVIGMIGLLASGLTFAQYEYYDPYSNSNIDYFPTNPVPVYKSPSQTQDSGTNDSTSGGTISGGTITAPTPTSCANKPKANPQNTRSVEIRDKSGKVFYLSPPKEELIGIKAYPETSPQIFKIIYGASGIQESEYVIGLITVNNQCYPKYGYVQNNAVIAPTTSPSALPLSNIQNTESITTVPENATAVNLNPATGKVYNAKTSGLINEARYDAATRKIYYKDTDSTFGKVFTDTTGYVNMDLRGLSGTSASPLPPSDVNRYLPKVTPSPVSVDIDRRSAVDDRMVSPTPSHGIMRSDFDVEELSDGIISDSDFDLLNIAIGGDELKKFRTDVSVADYTKKVTVGGWDPEKKAEIVSRPEVIKTPEDLKVYVEAVALNDAALKSIKVKKDIIEVESRELGKLFWFIPVEMPSTVIVKYDLRDDSEDEVNVRFPWWHIFVKKSYSPHTLRADLVKRLDMGMVKKTNDLMPQNKVSQISQILRLVSDIMKTRHDTVKNSISNIR